MPLSTLFISSEISWKVSIKSKCLPNNKLKADLKYPSEYQIVNFYHSYLSLNNNIGNTYTKMERIIGVEEELNYELNYDYSENYSYNIIFTDIDNYGIKIYINGMAYE